MEIAAWVALVLPLLAIAVTVAGVFRPPAASPVQPRGVGPRVEPSGSGASADEIRALLDDFYVLTERNAANRRSDDLVEKSDFLRIRAEVEAALGSASATDREIAEEDAR